MTDFEYTYSDISLDHTDETRRRLVDEISLSRSGRELVYASVDNPKTFVSDMKPMSGRLMDFNKGMN
jgi:hypothetical protein